MKVQFMGAAQTVTGSKHIITTKQGKRILLDCGMFQGRGADTDTLNRHFGFAPYNIDCLILSHAHIDHSGLIPLLVKEGFNGKIYATHGTCDLCEAMLLDSARIQQADVLHINKKRVQRGQEPLKPLYTEEDARAALALFTPIEYGVFKHIDKDTGFTFTDAGHILGSTAVHLNMANDNDRYDLTFTGDIGRPKDRILRAPEPFPQSNFIICESTYGNRLHPSEANLEEQLFHAVYDTCIEQKGKVIIPAFSLDRTQELVYALDRMKTKGMLPPIRVFVDSPLSLKTTQIMRNNAQYFNDEIIDYMERTDGEPFIFQNITYISDVNQSKALNSYNEPCIIISASGMAEAGRIKHHIAHNVSNPRNTILIVGYCTPGSLGGQLRAGEKQVRIFGDEYEVMADVRVLDGYSAHADYSEIQQFLSCQKAELVRDVFLVHGELPAMTFFKDCLHQQGFKNVHIPEAKDTYSF